MVVKISRKGINLIKDFEGFVANRYKCIAGKDTIGYGHVINDTDSFGLYQNITQQQAEDLLIKDVKAVEKALSDLIKVEISQNMVDSLISLVFNIGIDAFSGSTLLRRLNAGQDASMEFDKWIYVQKKVSNGLVARRAKEKELYLK